MPGHLREKNFGPGNLKDMLAGIGLGIVLKWLLGSDDMVWIAPFMAKGKVRHKLRMGFKYVASVVFLTLLACILGNVINTSASASGGAIIDEIIGTTAGTFLFLYAIYMAHEEGYFEPCTPVVDADDGPTKGDENYGATQLTKMGGDDDDDDDLPSGPIADRLATGLRASSDAIDACCCCCPDDEDDDDLEKGKKQNSDVVVVAFLGSVDDFMVYFTIALSNRITWIELLIGVTIGAIMIALVVGTLLEASETLANFVQTIPVPLVLATLSVYIIASAWLGE